MRSDLTEPAAELRDLLLAVQGAGLGHPHLEPQLTGAIATLDRTILWRAALEDAPLVVALVGPGGTGKSTLFNALAGRDLAPVGPLRPTTRQPAAWGDPAGRLGGVVAETAPEPPPGIVVIDTPAWEHDRSAVRGVLAGCDLALVVTSPLRYADSLTREVMSEARGMGVPVAFALSRLASVGQDADDVRADAERKYTDPPVVAVAGSASSVRALMDGLVFSRDDLVAARLAAAVESVTLVTDLTAGTVARRRGAAADLAAVVDSAYLLREDGGSPTSLTGADPGVLWEEAKVMLVRTIRERRQEALDSVAAGWRAAGPSAPAPDVHPEINEGVVFAELDAWRDATESAARRAVRPRLLGRWGRRAVSDEVWRLALFPEREPSSSVRFYLGRRLSELRDEATEALSQLVGYILRDDAMRCRTLVAFPDVPSGANLVQAATRLQAATPGSEPRLALVFRTEPAPAPEVAASVAGSSVQALASERGGQPA